MGNQKAFGKVRFLPICMAADLRVRDGLELSNHAWISFALTCGTVVLHGVCCLEQADVSPKRRSRTPWQQRNRLFS